MLSVFSQTYSGLLLKFLSVFKMLWFKEILVSVQIFFLHRGESVIFTGQV